MQEIQDYFDILTAEGREIMPKVFIATDEPKIIDEIQTKVNIMAKLYIPSTLNIDFILWHTQLIVYVLKC